MAMAVGILAAGPASPNAPLSANVSRTRHYHVMIRFTVEGGEVACITELRDRVGVYLDNDSLIELSKGDRARQDRFVAAVERRATLLFSFTNAVELSGPQGESAKAVWAFLDRIGSRWVPLQLNPWTVVRREQDGLGARAPVSEQFIEAYVRERMYELSCGVRSVLDLSAYTFFRLSVVAQWAFKDREQIRIEGQAVDRALAQRISDERATYDIDPHSLDQSFPAIPFDDRRPATFVLFHLLRKLVQEARAFHFKPHDGLDLCHAVLAASYAGLATLDRHWKRRVETLPKPNRLSKIYYRPEVDELVGLLDSLVAST